MLANLFRRLDQRRFLNIPIWEFSYHSFFKEYARLFLLRAVLAHPRKTLRGLRRYASYLADDPDLPRKYQDALSIPGAPETSLGTVQTSQPVVGVGFCLKPQSAEARFSCPSGHANHDCLYLETGTPQQACSSCEILRIALQARTSGYGLYIMTSAKDIAEDLLLPQVKHNLFPKAILCLCPYSIQAILPALFICGIEALLLAYKTGSCRDYKEWRLADLGRKKERTALSEKVRMRLFDFMETSGDAVSSSQGFKRRGHIYFPS